MLAAVAGWCAQNDISLRVSLEERMGCGYGACAGCTAKTRSLNDPEKPQNGPNNAGEDGVIKKKVCVHGPVFWADEVVW
jgi:dihydroorotate dehydrogenase electron transfer subunit